MPTPWDHERSHLPAPCITAGKLTPQFCFNSLLHVFLRRVHLAYQMPCQQNTTGGGGPRAAVCRQICRRCHAPQALRHTTLLPSTPSPLVPRSLLHQLTTSVVVLSVSTRVLCFVSTTAIGAQAQTTTGPDPFFLLWKQSARQKKPHLAFHRSPIPRKAKESTARRWVCQTYHVSNVMRRQR